MPIQVPSPVVVEETKLIPQVESKTFDSYWITDLRILSSPEGTRVAATFSPWNTQTGEVSNKPQHQRFLHLPNIQAQIAGGDQQLGGVFLNVVAELERQAREMKVI